MRKEAVDKKTKTTGNNFLLLLAGALFIIVSITLYRVTGNKPDYTSLIQEAESNLIIESDSLLKKAARKETEDARSSKTEKIMPAKAERPAETPPLLKTERPKPLLQATGGTSEHIVQRGETLFKIAAKYGVSADQLKSVNNLTNDNLQIDQVLRIPAADVAISQKSNSTTTKHIVQSGEGLFSIARKYNISVKELAKANNLSEEQPLKEGQELLIPSK
jgi:LysM repeat protein